MPYIKCMGACVFSQYSKASVDECYLLDSKVWMSGIYCVDSNVWMSVIYSR